MANFCANCGAPVAGRFCAACGASVQAGGTPAPVPGASPAASAASGGVSAAKVILIVIAVIVALGAMGIGSLVYVGYRAKQKIAEFKREYGAAPSVGSTSNAPVVPFAAPKGSGCPMLEGQEAAQILGAGIERVEFMPSGAEGSEECRYWVSAVERQRLAKSEIARGVGAIGRSGKTLDKDGKEGFENLVAGALGAAIEAAGDNKDQDPALILQVYRSRGREMWDKFEAANSSVKSASGVDYGALGVQPVEGVGSKALLLPGGHSIMALKGDQFFLLSFQQFAPGRDKTIALAKVVAGRL